MRMLIWPLALLTSQVWAQAPQTVNKEFAKYYFESAQKDKRIQYIEDNIYNQPRHETQPGCRVLKRPQPPFSDVEKRVDEVIELVNKKFSQSMAENPEIKNQFEADLKAIASDPSCKEEDNICRGKLVATAKFHYENLRPDIPGCKGYDGSNYNQACELEKKYRSQRLETYSRGGLDARATYTDQLVAELNRTTNEILKRSLHRSLGFTKGSKKQPPVEVFDMQIPEICAQGPFAFNLQENLYKDPIVALAPVSPEPVKKPEPKPCEIQVTESMFVPLNFDEGRATVGADQVEPVKKAINDFMAQNNKLNVSSVQVTSNSSRTPFYISVGGKKVIDPKSDEKNLELAKQRSAFAEKALSELKSSQERLASATLETKFSLAGPAFDAKDLNNRFVTKQTPGYQEKVKEYFNANKNVLLNQAVIKSPEELLNQNRFTNLYQVKYKPFQGFRIVITGTDTRKCEEDKKAEDKKSGKGGAKIGKEE